MKLYSTATTCPNYTTNLRLTGQNVAAMRFFFWIPCLQSLTLATIFETTRQFREAKILLLVALSLIFRILPRCRGREKILSLICDNRKRNVCCGRTCKISGIRGLHQDIRSNGRQYTVHQQCFKWWR